MRILLDHRRPDKPPRTWRQIGGIGTLIFLLLLAVSIGVTIGTIVLILKVASFVSGG